MKKLFETEEPMMADIYTKSYNLIGKLVWLQTRYLYNVDNLENLLLGVLGVAHKYIAVLGAKSICLTGDEKEALQIHLDDMRKEAKALSELIETYFKISIKVTVNENEV